VHIEKRPALKRFRLFTGRIAVGKRAKSRKIKPRITTRKTIMSQQKTYTPSPQLKANQERAAKLYPHRLITPGGIGNETQYPQKTN